MRRITLLLLALGALGCSTAGTAAGTPPPEVSLENKVWAKSNEAYAGRGEFERASATCGGRGDGELPEVSAGPGARREFIRCMADEGWILVDAP